MKIVGK